MSDTEIGRTIAHASFNVLAFDTAIIDFNMDAGMPNGQSVDDWQQKMSGDTLISCKPHDSGQGVRFRQHRALRQPENLTSFQNYPPSRCSRSRSGSGTLKQLIPKRAFQRSDRMADAGLGATQLRSRSSEAAG